MGFRPDPRGEKTQDNRGPFLPRVPPRRFPPQGGRGRGDLPPLERGRLRCHLSPREARFHCHFPGRLSPSLREKVRVKRIIILGGPTATGKSDLALYLAERFPLEIVNFDSVQVYRYMDIGTAKPAKEERERVPHHLYDIRDPDEEFSAGEYVRVAPPVIEEVLSRGRIPILVGGTGLYARALLYGLDELPSSDRVREELMERLEREGLESLWREMAGKDPESGRVIPPGDTHRVLRALEVMALTGEKYSALKRAWRERKPRYEHLFLATHMEREEVYRRINERAERMIREGLVDEVRGILAMGYSPDLKPLRSHGYKHVIQFLRGEMSLEEALEEMKKEIRHYAKRQITWFKKENPTWVDPREREKVAQIVGSFLI
ncbi:MAG: tRNA (adenosine(37)-N6)-dimethylallyltransferase MiaA [Deltaproteobacteria bacterium]|nr:MAG: tRNA (adenosine(37)-N6)-dimethylallyltransferase MiaA [Deltaproteobacteria bacterium]